MPAFLTGCVKNLRANYLTQEREQYSDGNMVVDARPIVKMFQNLNYGLQNLIAKRVGFESLKEMQKILIDE